MSAVGEMRAALMDDEVYVGRTARISVTVVSGFGIHHLAHSEAFSRQPNMNGSVPTKFRLTDCDSHGPETKSGN